MFKRRRKGKNETLLKKQKFEIIVHLVKKNGTPNFGVDLESLNQEYLNERHYFFQRTKDECPDQNS